MKVEGMHVCVVLMYTYMNIHIMHSFTDSFLFIYLYALH